MKKIGILTFQRAHNYGAVLQAYALSTYLKKFNLDVEIVDYWPDYRKGMYDLFDVNFKQKSLTKNLKEIIKTIIGFRKKYIRYNKFKKFISNELGLKNKKSFNKGNQISSSYDYLFFGSDQIWRYNEFLSYKGLDPVYWGEYPSGNKVKKIAYAASMGILNPELLDKNKISKYLANFNSLAVREEVLKNYVKPLTNTSVEHVLDPVFLINPKEWRTLANKSGYKKEFRKKYLLLYNLNTSEKTYSIVNKIAKEKNLEIYELSGSTNPFKYSNNIREKYGPMEFLNAFINAEFIVSTSFHGVAFSILFNKNFLSLGLRNNADRVKSLLLKLDISDRYVESDNLPPLDINYSVVNHNLNEMINKSKRYIDINLK